MSHKRSTRWAMAMSLLCLAIGLANGQDCRAIGDCQNWAGWPRFTVCVNDTPRIERCFDDLRSARIPGHHSRLWIRDYVYLEEPYDSIRTIFGVATLNWRLYAQANGRYAPVIEPVFLEDWDWGTKDMSVEVLTRSQDRPSGMADTTVAHSVVQVYCEGDTVHIAGDTIYLNAYHFCLAELCGGESSDCDVGDDRKRDVLSVCEHEIGHLYGLSHPVPDPSDPSMCLMTKYITRNDCFEACWSDTCGLGALYEEEVPAAPLVLDIRHDGNATLAVVRKAAAGPFNHPVRLELRTGQGRRKLLWQSWGGLWGRELAVPIGELGAFEGSALVLSVWFADRELECGQVLLTP